MADEKTRVILSVEVDNVEALRRASALQKVVNELSQEKKELNSAYRQGLVTEQEYATNLNKINLQLQQTRKELKLTNREVLAGDDSLEAQRVELIRLTSEWDKLTIAQRENSEEGQRTKARIIELTAELNKNEQATGRFGRNVGNYAQSIRDAFAGGFGEIVSSFAGPAVVAAAGITALQEGAQAMIEITRRVEEQRREIATLTGATGDSLDEYTAKIAAASSTFEQDFNTTLIATNSLTKQLGGDFVENADLISQGLALAGNQGGELLDIIREYPAIFQETGVSANDFVAIASQQISEGIYSDKGVDAIKEGLLSIREMTPATDAAIEGIGLSSKAIQQGIADGTLTAFDAVQMISGRLAELPPQSQEVGTAIADIFRGAGEDAGIQYLTTIKDINLNLDETISSSSEYVKQQVELNKVTQELEMSFNELLGGTTGLFAELEIIGKKALNGILTGLIALINAFKAIPEFIRENKVELIALGVALVTLNAQAILAAANSLRMAAAQKAVSIATAAQAGAQRVLNLVMNANPIGLVITAAGLLVGAFAALYNRSQTLRAGLSGFFEAIKKIGSNYISAIVDQFTGLGEIIAGVFTLDLDRIKAGAQQALQGVKGLYGGLGDGVGEAFNKGFSDKIEQETAAAAEKAAVEAGAAFSQKFGEKPPFDDPSPAAEKAAMSYGKKLGEKVGEGAEKGAKEALVKGTISYLRAQISALQKEFDNATTNTARLSIKRQIAEMEKELKRMQNPVEIPVIAKIGKDEIRDIAINAQAELDVALKDVGGLKIDIPKPEPIDVDLLTPKEALEATATAFNNLSSAMSPVIEKRQEDIRLAAESRFSSMADGEAKEAAIAREIAAQQEKDKILKISRGIQKSAAIADMGISLAQQLQTIALTAAKISGSFPPISVPLGIAYGVAQGAAAVIQARARIAEIRAMETGGITGQDGQPMQITHEGRIVKQRKAHLPGRVNAPTLALIGERGPEYVAPSDQIKRMPELFTYLNQERKQRNGNLANLKVKPFAEGGYTLKVPAFADGGFSARQASLSVTKQLETQAVLDLNANLQNMPPPIVTVEDINAGFGRVAQVESSATI